MPRSAPKTPAISRTDAIRVAGLVPCDPRTVQNYFRGSSTSIVASARIAEALKELGIADPRAGQEAHP